MPTTEMTKQEKIDAAVGVVQEEVARAFAEGEEGFRSRAGYLDAESVAGRLEKHGVLVRQDAEGYNAQERAPKRVIGQVKRLLDEEAGKPDARILRLSSRDHQTIPCLDGRPRQPYGNTVYYTTPELFRVATAAVEAARAAERALHDDMAALRERARAAEIPEPSSENAVAATYGVEAYRSLVEAYEHLLREHKYLVTGEES